MKRASDFAGGIVPPVRTVQTYPVPAASTPGGMASGGWSIVRVKTGSSCGCAHLDVVARCAFDRVESQNGFVAERHNRLAGIEPGDAAAAKPHGAGRLGASPAIGANDTSAASRVPG